MHLDDKGFPGCAGAARDWRWQAHTAHPGLGAQALDQGGGVVGIARHGDFGTLNLKAVQPGAVGKYACEQVEHGQRRRLLMHLLAQ